MIDVHAPEHSISGKRDFFLHLFTITVGLLIALALENAAEAWHHHEQRREAQAKIREEIRHNLEGLQKNAPGLKQEYDTMSRLFSALRAEQHGAPFPLTDIHVAFHEEEIPDAAWRTASSTGVLEYMPYDEVERFADAYREQALLQTMAQNALNDYLELTPMLDRQPSKQDADVLLPVVQRTLGHLRGIAAAGQGTLESYKAALQ
ncbi:MAG TPA: hypothetical protein VGU25_14925 [Acidobacteriaceae bacterium]|nr:hypothetical protein [Acidobacteriaceae bacterium]